MDIICVGQTTWEGDYQKAIVQLCCELAVRHRVLYVDYQHTAKDWLMGALGRQKDVPVRKIVRLENPLTTKAGEQGSTVHVWQPPMMLPINALPTVAHDRLHSLNMTRLLSGMRGIMNQLGFRNPIASMVFIRF